MNSSCPHDKTAVNGKGLMISRGLYAGVLGDRWTQLAEVVRRLHTEHAIVRAAGRFRVERGRGRAARMLACLMGMPRDGEDVELRLVVTPSEGHEEWRRDF